MTNNFKSDVEYVPYKEILNKRSLDYCYANKDIITEKSKSKYQSLSPEQKKKRQEHTKQWFNRQSPEQQAEIRQKTREYHKNRYRNLMVSANNMV